MGAIMKPFKDAFSVFKVSAPSAPPMVSPQKPVEEELESDAGIQAKLRRRGRASTVLTSQMGLEDETEGSLAKKTLLGD